MPSFPPSSTFTHNGMSVDNKFPNIAYREVLRFQISNTCIPGVRGSQRFYNTAECMPESAVRQAPPSLSVPAKHCKPWNSLLRPCACGGIYPKRHDQYREAPRPVQDKISVGQRSFALHSQADLVLFFIKTKNKTKQNKQTPKPDYSGYLRRREMVKCHSSDVSDTMEKYFHN